MGSIFPRNKEMALNSRFILGGALVAAAAHSWWTQPVACEMRKPAREASSWDRCSSCEDRLYNIYRFQDASYCRQCLEELEQETETSDEEEI